MQRISNKVFKGFYQLERWVSSNENSRAGRYQESYLVKPRKIKRSEKTRVKVEGVDMQGNVLI